jgi:hypothetical protein
VLGLVIQGNPSLSKSKNTVLENPTVAQLLRKFPTFYGAWRFITLFTNAHHWSASWAKLIPSTLYPISVRSILTSSIHLCLGLPTGSILQVFLPKLCCYMPCPPHSPWVGQSDIWRGAQVMKLLSMHIVPTSYNFIPLRSKYSPQHPLPILSKHLCGKSPRMLSETERTPHAPAALHRLSRTKEVHGMNLILIPAWHTLRANAETVLQACLPHVCADSPFHVRDCVMFVVVT